MNAAVPSLLNWDSLEHAFGAPVLDAVFKQQPQDFHVDEVLGFEPDGAGEHLLLQVEKTGLTTFEAQALLARHYNAAVRDTAFSGMKDKQGVTRQWFSVPARAAAAPAAPPEHAQLRVLRAERNSRKLRRGAHRANRFRIVLRAPSGDVAAARERLQLLAQHGVPNYFGVQRFGHAEGNVPQALAWFRGALQPARAQRSLLLSAARSYLFNVHLSARVRAQTWHTAIPGDVMALAGSASTFAASRASAEELAQRLAEFDIHVTGPLWGKGPLAVSDDALHGESRLAEMYPDLCAGLEAHGLEQERRPLRAEVAGLHAEFAPDALVLEFSLARGAYATSVLRELIHLERA